MKRRYDLVVFDWDGTLMDSEAKIVRCLSAAMRDAGVSDPGDEAVRDIIGLGMEEAAGRLVPGLGTQVRDKVIERFRQHYLHLDKTELAFFPGVEEGLNGLAQDGYLLAVATGRPRRGLDRLMAEAGLEQLFVATRCADEAFSKPHPAMLEDILDETGVTTKQTLMVGDTVYDMQMARNAGVEALAVSYGVHDRARLLACGPVACLDSFDEVCRWL
ncbi:MAG: HAD-IA family hydrolase [Acidiferrobacterales bacterium]